ncbi:Nuclear pore glycoprotein p62 [Smittium culicis]|uniref:Nuclear pore glycoprotein p62 n=1 Tax=Smittium culicis TaxID=133412 RepID=A0A1R1X1X9_9FUNG|nr:Nuclear pore glycoprotein p62 [Smittium culicis]
MTDKPSLFGSGAFTSTSGGGLFGNGSNSTTNPSGQGTTSSLFGNSNSNSQISSTNLFGNSNTAGQSSGASLFGTGNATSGQSTGASLFGSGNATSGQSTGNSLFGNNNSSNQTTSSSLFGGNSTGIGQNSSTSLFGNANTGTNQTSSTGLFGSSKPAENKATSSGLFGSTASATNQNSSSNLFGNSSAAAPQSTASTLFGNNSSTTNQKPTSLFGGSTNAAQATSLTTSEPSKTGFSFGGSSTSTGASASTTTTEPAKTGGFSFGGTSILNPATSDASAANNKTFSFGGSGASTQDAKSASEKPSTSLFGSSTQSTGLFSAAQTTSNTTNTNPATSEAPKPSLFSSSNFSSKLGTSNTQSDSSEKKEGSTSTSLFGAAISTGANSADAKPSLFSSTSGATASTSTGNTSESNTKNPNTDVAPQSKPDATASSSDPKIGINEVVSDISTKMLESKNLGDIIDVWTDELTNQIKQFHTQASVASKWESQLIEQGKQISKLHEIANLAEADQSVLDQSLDHMEAQQRVLVSFLDKYEPITRDMVQKTNENNSSQSNQVISSFGGTNGYSMELKTVEEEREQVYNMSEQLNAQLDEMTKCLTGLIEEANTVTELSSAMSLVNTSSQSNNGLDGISAGGTSLKAADPIVVIMKILNANLTSLESIEEQTNILQQRLSYLKSVNNNNNNNVGDRERNNSQISAADVYDYENHEQFAPPVKTIDYNIEDRERAYGGSRSLFSKDGLSQNSGMGRFSSPSLSRSGNPKPAYMSPYSTRATSLFGYNASNLGGLGQGSKQEAPTPSFGNQNLGYNKVNDTLGIMNSPFHKKMNVPSTPIRGVGIGGVSSIQQSQQPQPFGSVGGAQFNLPKQRRW